MSLCRRVREAASIIAPMSFPTRRDVLSTALAGLAWTAGASVVQAQSMVQAWPASRSAPSLSLPDLQRQKQALSSRRGSVVVLNFWASWCEPCVAEMPSLLRLAESRGDDRVVVLAINYQESPAKIRSFLETVLGEVPGTMPVLLDSDGAAAKAWTRRVFPTTVLVGRDGRPRWSVVGEFDWTGAEARRLLDPLVAAPSGGQSR